MVKSPIAEDALIDRIRAQVPCSNRDLLLRIGDDAAVIRPRRGTEWVVTCDQFIEGSHFLAEAYSPQAVGYKALARATSDLGAMGAQPRFFLLSLAIPAERTGNWLTDMAHGMARAARQFGLVLAGGDTSRSTPRNPGVVLNLMVIGEVARGRFVTRSGARPGDSIFVTGTLGASQLGLELILHGFASDRRVRQQLAPHLYPKPPIELGSWLAETRLVSAMMDVSDGLSTDLYRLCRASHAAARIYEDALPGVKVPAKFPVRGLDRKALALHGGEDYGLLFTVPKKHLRRVPRKFKALLITRIGEIVAGAGVSLIGHGNATQLKPMGWDHFRKTK